MTLSTTSCEALPDATDLGFVVQKHPGRAQSFTTAAGTAHVVWPQASPDRATVALLVEVDPVELVRGHGGGSGVDQHVNDRPYAASSLLSVAIGKVFRTALSGRCEARPDLVGAVLPLQVHVASLPSRGGPALVERLFAPLGWQVEAVPLPLDPQLPAWGPSEHVDLTLTGHATVADALSQLYVLVPVLDDAKHYWVGDGEVDKLLRAGGTWLASHPETDLITRRYLKHQRDLVATAAERLAEVDGAVPLVTDDAVPARPLAHLRSEAVVAALKEEGARSVVDLGCGEGALLRVLVPDPAFSRVTGVDVSARALATAERRLGLDRLPDSQRDRLTLLQSSATYRDDRLAGNDAVVLMEVVEHVDPERLPALERSVLAHARPVCVVVTTPNAEHNVRYPSLAPGQMRHPDHRFEWTRAEFRSWANRAADAHGYTVRFLPVGPDDAEVGPPTQMAVLRRSA